MVLCVNLNILTISFCAADRQKRSSVACRTEKKSSKISTILHLSCDHCFSSLQHFLRFSLAVLMLSGFLKIKAKNKMLKKETHKIVLNFWQEEC